MTWRVDFVRSKDAQKQLARTSLNHKAKILWKFEDLQNYKDLYGKPQERDWSLPTQIALIYTSFKIPSWKKV